MSDAELIAQSMGSQDPRYFGELYKRYAGRVYAKCISMLNDEGLARDAMQEIFIKVLLNLSRFNAQSTFSTWVYSITYNYCIDLIRRKKKLNVVFSEDVGKLSKEVDVEVPDSVLLEIKQEQLREVMKAMPPGDKAILMMKYIDDLSIRDIADVLGKSESAIKMQIMRAKQKAQQIYKQQFAGKAV
jgi:RNA polymerase sigma factor (sigma-70 family)